MSDLNNLQGAEAIKQIKTIVDHNKVCMFCTDVEQIPFPTRPMGVQEVDENGAFWFLSGRDSNKNEEVQEDRKVQLIFGDLSRAEYLSVSGTATVFYDRKNLEELWNPMAKAWFNEGKDDPNLTVIRVTPEEGYYWDTKDGKTITMVKIAVGAITGKTLDGGVEGKLSV